MMQLRRLAAYGVLTSTFLLPFGLPAAGLAQQNTLEPRSATGENAAAPNWSKEQLLTSTVHQAWLLSGKNEATFFEMVKQLAELSASNRGIALPESEAAGRRMGEYIKRSAKADTDQLLYAVVDKAVLMTSKTPVHQAGQAR
jgi:hypothetical protein